MHTPAVRTRLAAAQQRPPAVTAGGHCAAAQLMAAQGIHCRLCMLQKWLALGACLSASLNHAMMCRQPGEPGDLAAGVDILPVAYEQSTDSEPPFLRSQPGEPGGAAAAVHDAGGPPAGPAAGRHEDRPERAAGGLAGPGCLPCLLCMSEGLWHGMTI